MMTRTLLATLGLLMALSAPLQAALVFSTGASWRFFKGRTEASTPDATSWRGINFADTAFVDAPAPFWYGDVLPGGTQLTDMQNQYTTIFLRRTFTLASTNDISALRLTAACDDGFIVDRKSVV